MKPDGAQRLTVFPCDLARANAFVGRFHRHHRPALGHKFCLAVADEAGLVRGVAIASRPVARLLDDGWTAEVTRVATDECPNACSALYGAAWRTAKAMGYRRLVTYTLPSESGGSLRGAGWRLVADATGGGSWKRPKQANRLGRRDDWPLEQKRRWEMGDPPPYPPRPDFGADDTSAQLGLPLEMDAAG